MHSPASATEHRVACKLMGSAFELVLVHPGAAEARALLHDGIAEIRRIEALLSEFRAGSVTESINRNAGIHAIETDQEVFDLIERCMRISALTRGAFDITVGPLKKLYRFDNTTAGFPPPAALKTAMQNVGWEYIKTDRVRQTVFLSRKNMRISFAAIGKGYAADRVKKLWAERGAAAGVINASGDLCTLGCRPDGSPWNVGIAHPDRPGEIALYLPLWNAAFATSGNYEQFFMHRGIRYGHTINPKTGLPVTGIKSVSILSPGAELSDALATAVYVMGIDAGLHLVDQLPDTHCIVIDDRNEFHFSELISRT